MAHSHSPAAQQPRDPIDPHGFHTHEHGHTILPMRLLLATLIALLAMTVLTVFASRAEMWIAEVTGVVLPHWLNVAVALSIATVKSILVLGIFMQLYFDKPLNTAIFSSCILCLALFLGFTMADLGSRGMIHTRNAGHVRAGGSGFGLNFPEFVGSDGKPVALSGKNVFEAARARAIAEAYGTESSLQKAVAEHKKGDHSAPLPTADRSITRTGLTPGLFENAPAAPASHDSHGGH